MQCPHCKVEVPKDLTVCPGCDFYVGSHREETPIQQSFLKSLRPKSRFDFFILIAAIVAAAGYWGFLQFNNATKTSTKKAFQAPDSIDMDLIRIYRSAENEVAAEIHKRWTGRGFKDVTAGVYEFTVLPYRPVFFFAAAKGTGIDRQAIVENEVSLFSGTMSEEKKAVDTSHEGIAFLCAPFNRGSGLVSLSAICVWDDGKTVGAGIRIAGGAIEDTLRYTAEARKALINPVPSNPFEDPPRRSPENEGEIETTIRDIVASLKSYQCERFRTFLPQGAEEMFNERINEDLLDTMKDPVERICFVLSTLNFPRSETMKIEKTEESLQSVTLVLKDIEGVKETIEIPLVKTSDGYKVDPEWAFKKVQEHHAKLLQYK